MQDGVCDYQCTMLAVSSPRLSYHDDGNCMVYGN